MGNSANKGTLSEPVELRTLNDLLAVNGVAQLATISAAVIDGDINDALNSEDGRVDCWNFETKNGTYQIYRWCTGGVWVGGASAKGSKEMCAEISDGQFSASTAEKETKSLAKELQAAFDEQAASWVEDELADTDDEEASDKELDLIDEAPMEVSHAESVESDDEVTVQQAETEDEPAEPVPITVQETAPRRTELAEVVEKAEAPVKQPKRATRRKATVTAPAAEEVPKRSTRKKAASTAAVVATNSDNMSTASAALSAVTSEPLPGDLTKMRVVDLRQELKARQQTGSGLKKDLVARLQGVLKQEIGQVA